ncbi:MAG: hypothetical protein ACFB10_09310 [Salibacteraceae bacterium]
MPLHALQLKTDGQSSTQLLKWVDAWEKLWQELENRELTERVAASLNADIAALNQDHGIDKDRTKALRKHYNAAIQLLVKEMKLTPLNYHRDTWFVIGLAAFGTPLGIIVSFSLNSFAYIGLGFPFGMGLGMLLGMQMDKKAAREGRQLNLQYQR